MHNAMLLEQAVPGYSLKSLYPTRINDVMDAYCNTVRKLHGNSLHRNLSFGHISDWLTAIDHADKNKLPAYLIEKAIYLKNNLLKAMKTELLLHGDLHHDNVLQHGNEWIAIDPKGVVGEAEFEIAAFDFISSHEIENKNIQQIFDERIKWLSKKSHLNSERVRDWVFIRLILSAAWSVEDNDDPSWAIKRALLLYEE